MSLIVKRSDPYDDTDARNAIIGLFESQLFEMQPNEKVNGIDLSGMKNGRVYAFEVAQSSDWLHGDQDFPLAFVEIPQRKWVYFKGAFNSDDHISYDVGMYCLLSKDCSRVALLNFKDLLSEEGEVVVRTWNDRTCYAVKVPAKYIKKYMDIPEEFHKSV